MPMPSDQDLMQQVLASQGAAPAPQQGVPVPQGEAPAQGMPPGASQMPQEASQAPTPMESATKAAEPATGDSQAPIDVLDIKMSDGSMRQFTPQQISSTMDRYADMSYKWQQNKEVLDFVQRISDQARQKGYEPKPGEIAKLLEQATKAFMQNAKMGNTQGQKPQAPDNADGKPAQPPIEDQYSAWERDNGLKLPPGFREQGSALTQMQQQLSQMQQMLQQMQGQGRTQQQTGQQALQQAQQIQGRNQQEQVKMNLREAANRNQVPPEKANDFMLFAMQRGYTPADFFDPQIANTVMADFKANMDAPEIQRLRSVMQRRQAYSGSPTGTPSASGAGIPPQMSGNQQFFNQFVDKLMAQRSQ